MGSFSTLTDTLLALAIKALTLFFDLLITILTAFITFFQGLIGILHG